MIVFYYPELITLALLAIATSCVVGLVAIWAGLGRPHWFLRIVVLGAVLSLGLMIPAYELVEIFFIQSAVMIGVLLFARALRARADGARLRLQFTVLDLLLLTVVVAVVLAVGVNVPADVLIFYFWYELLFGIIPFPPPPLPSPWLVYGLLGPFLGISALVAAWAALGRSGLRWRLAVLCLSPPSWPLAGWLALRRRNGYPARVALVVLSLLILLPPAAMYYVLMTPPPIPKTTLPEPNGYVELIRAGKWIANVTVPDVDTATPAELYAQHVR